MQDFKKLKVWQMSHHLTLDLYRITSLFPRSELYGLTSQIRRSASSVPANIAEGCGRYGNAELTRFLHISMGSASELEYHILLAHDLKFMSTEDYNNVSSRLIDIKRMLTGLTNKTRTYS